MIPCATVSKQSEEMIQDILTALTWMYDGLGYQFVIQKSQDYDLFLIYVNDSAEDRAREQMNRFVAGLVYAWNHPRQDMIIGE